MALLTLDDLLRASRAELQAIVDRGCPLDADVLAGQQYQGIDLSLPPWLNRVLWKTFRKTFHRDADTGEVRGWNVRLQQTGIDGPQQPLLDRHGRARTFGHYRLRSAAGVRFPGGWQGGHFLDYRGMGNWPIEGWGHTPLVAVNEGRMDLLLGWEVMKVGALFVPLPDFWALRLEGPLAQVVPVPR